MSERGSKPARRLASMSATTETHSPARKYRTLARPLEKMLAAKERSATALVVSDGESSRSSPA
jgi:hypothetical protein